VIKALWVEHCGNPSDKMTIITDPRFPDEQYVSKVRWFVIIKDGMNFCSCL